MSAAPAPLNGSSPWSARYASELRRVVTEHAERSPRNLQLQLGPSEVGVACDRQVVGKMAGLAKTNHVSDPWPSIVGVAVHAWLAEAFAEDNRRRGLIRWVPEQRVVTHPDTSLIHPGTGDLYDAVEQAVGDHKVLGESTAAKVRSVGGPPRKYVVQLLLYGEGFRRLGLPVRRVALIVWPRTGSSLDGLYVWDREHGSADDELLDEVFRVTRVRQQLAVEVHSGRLSINHIPLTPDNDECFFCPFYRPQSARDGGPGCPGTVSPPAVASAPSH
jgi:hypothetical protein